VLERGGRVYAVTGGHPEQTDRAALRELARLVAEFPGRALAYLATPGNGRQNGKTYYVRGEHGAAAYVGSANLTRGGLETNQETGITLNDADDDPAVVEAVLNGIMAWCGHPAAEGQAAFALEVLGVG
jgi:HKD family nuclease